MSEDGPRPCDGLEEAGKQIGGLEERRNTIKSQRVAYDVTAIVAKQDDQETCVEKFTDYCNDKLGRHHYHSPIHLLFQFANDVFYVKKRLQ